MTTERLKQIEELFLAAMALPAHEQRTLLDQKCSGDRELRTEVEALLGHHHAPSGMLDAPDSPGQTLRRGLANVDEAEEVVLPRQRKIGAYTISRLLGTGGMGVVYVAEQDRPKRTVALKLIRRGLATPKLIRRFEHEAEVLGRLHHPGIAQIYEAGTVPIDANSPFSGQPFIAMEYVDGVSLNKHVSERRLDARACMELMVRVCDAVEHAHQRGVIHRDLKPGNILVGADGHPKVLDFGIARAVDAEAGVTGGVTTLQTGIGQLIGTLPYMSPEQVGADTSEVDTRSDIYALGVIMYEMLSGKLPHNLKSRSIPDAARVIREEEPARLSSVSRVFRGDIDTIVLKSMEKDKSRRYQSASELAADIRRYLAGEPIAGRRDSSMYLLSKQLKRYRGALIAAAVFVLGILAFAVYASVQAREQWKLATAEREARHEADAARDFARGKNEDLRRSAYVSAIGFSQAALAAKDVERVERVLDACPEDLRGWEWKYLRSIVDTSDRVLTMPEGVFQRLAGASATDRFLAWQPDSPIHVVDKITGNTVASLPQDPDARVESAAVSADGRTALLGTAKARCFALDLFTLEKRPFPRAEGMTVHAVAVWPDGLRALISEITTGKPWRSAIVSLETGETLREIPEMNGVTGAVSPDGAWFAVSAGNRLWVQDADGLKPPISIAPHRYGIRAIAFSPDSTRVATCANDGFVHVWKWTDGQTRSMRITDNKLASIVWSPFGRYIATAGTEGVITILDGETLQTITPLYGHAATVDMLLWFGNPDTLVSSARDRTTRWWRLAAQPNQPVTSVPAGVYSGAWYADSSAVVVGLRDGRVLKYRASDLRFEGELTRATGLINEIAISPDGSLLAAVADTGQCVVVHLPDAEELVRFKASDARAIEVNFSPDGQDLYVGRDFQPLAVYDPLTGELRREFEPGPAGALRCAASPDGKTVVVGYYDGQLTVHDAASGRAVRQLGKGVNWPAQLRVTRDSKEVIAVFSNGIMGVWNIVTGELVRSFTGHQNGIYSLSISPDGTRLATGGWDNTVRLWDYTTGLELMTLRPHIAELWMSDFSPDGKSMISASSDATLRMWRPIKREPMP